MKTLITRYALGLIVAVMGLTGMVLSSGDADAAPMTCYLIVHNGDEGPEEIVINGNGWKGHALHGDTILSEDVPCEEDEVL